MKTIIYSHPWSGSYNHAILDAIIKDLSVKGSDYQLIDLHHDNFNPVYSSNELKYFSKGDTPYQLVKDYQKKIKKSTELIFIFPIWWYDLPAMLKGFFDKVMLANFAFVKKNSGDEIVGLLTYIESVKIITTATLDKQYISNAIEGILMGITLPQLGIQRNNIKWIHFPKVDITTNEERRDFLQKIPNLI